MNRHRGNGPEADSTPASWSTLGLCDGAYGIPSSFPLSERSGRNRQAQGNFHCPPGHCQSFGSSVMARNRKASRKDGALVEFDPVLGHHPRTIHPTVICRTLIRGPSQRISGQPRSRPDGYRPALKAARSRRPWSSVPVWLDAGRTPFPTAAPCQTSYSCEAFPRIPARPVHDHCS